MVRYTSNTITIKNHKDINKPNEDYYLTDDEKGIYILVDGVSRDKVDGIYPNPSPSFLVSKIFVESVYKFLLNNFNENIFNLLYEAIKKGNEESRLRLPETNRSIPIPEGLHLMVLKFATMQKILIDSYLFYDDRGGNTNPQTTLKGQRIRGPQKLKFTYQEQKDYETIESDIANLEEKIEMLEAEMATVSTDFVKLNQLMSDKETAESLLEEKMNRWMYLEELAARIAEQ